VLHAAYRLLSRRYHPAAPLQLQISLSCCRAVNKSTSKVVHLGLAPPNYCTVWVTVFQPVVSSLKSFDVCHRSRSAFSKGPGSLRIASVVCTCLNRGINANHEMAGMGRQSDSDSESDMKLGVTSHVTISEAPYCVSPLAESSRNVAASVADAQKTVCPY